MGERNNSIPRSPSPFKHPKAWWRQRRSRPTTPVSGGPSHNASDPDPDPGPSNMATSHTSLEVPPRPETGLSSSPQPDAQGSPTTASKDNRDDSLPGDSGVTLRVPSSVSASADVVTPLADSGHPNQSCDNSGEQGDRTTSGKEMGSLVFGVVKSALDMVEKVSDPFPPLKAAVAGVNSIIKTIETVKGVKREFKDIECRVNYLRFILQYYGDQDGLPNKLRDPLNDLTRTFDDLKSTLEQKVARGRLKRVLEASGDVEAVDNALEAIKTAVTDFNMAALFVIGSSVEGIRKFASASACSAALNKLKPVSGAKRGPQSCLEGTRVKLISEVNDWVHVSDGLPILWLNGLAGTGKTTLATEIRARFLHSNSVLCSAFFCSRHGTPGHQDVRKIFPTLAHDLAALCPAYLLALLPILDDIRFDVEDLSVKEQYTALIEKPLRQAQLPENLVILFLGDALDECGEGSGSDTIENFLRSILSGNLPSGVKFLFTSRPEAPIPSLFASPTVSDRASQMIKIHDVLEYPVHGDIIVYLRTKLDQLLQCAGDIRTSRERQVQMLADRAGNLFIYASTACKYIMAKNGYPDKRLSKVASSETQQLKHNIDELYSFILAAAFQDLEEDEAECRRVCLAAAVCAFEELSVFDIASLCNRTCKEVREALEPLHSVLHVSDGHDEARVSVFHASFPDYLTDSSRSGSKAWNIDLGSQHDRIARRCLLLLKQGLHFNLYDMATSYCTNDDQPQVRTPKTDLVYAAKSWAAHVLASQNGSSFADEIKEFLDSRFLFWLEIISYEKAIPTAQTSLLQLSRVFTHEISPSLNSMLRDANEFVVTSKNVIVRSIPHIYLSALPFIRRGSSIWQANNVLIHRTLTFNTQKSASRTSPLIIIDDHEGCVASVAYSPDGAYLASGCWNNRIRVWDAKTGALAVGPLEGHTDSVTSVAFSPNGTYLASGSTDKTIRVWDAKTGALAVGPLEGHTDSVNSVAFSPDGIDLVSDSDDNTVRVWNAKTGALAVDPLEGHTGAVNSVAYSPDGAYLASGSWDMTIRIWDAKTGALVLGPLEGHTSCICSVAFSPNGTYLVSDSTDKTIRVWDAKTGALAMNPLKGHAGAVMSIAFSPDGAYLASGSWDETIRIWDAKTGALVLGPLEGHTSCICSFAFSPNGTYLASGSTDKTIRVWDAKTGALVLGPLEGHTQYITSVAFSPDGAYLASGSEDRTIHVWDTETGALAVGPLEGHADWVNTVAFSPDGAYLASGSDDKTIRVWDAKTGTLAVGPLEGHTDSVKSVAFSPDGVYLASGSEDRTIRFWNMRHVADEVTSGPVDEFSSEDVSHYLQHSERWHFEDGWLIGPNGELLLWVPHRYRLGLRYGRCERVIGEPETVLDVTNLVHGKEWTQCFRGT